MEIECFREQAPREDIQKYEGYEYIEKLQAVPVLYECKENEINLSAAPDCDGLIYVSMPYISGWRAELDGAKTVLGYGLV